jgi:AAA domain/Bifunctional DNA primase/polymerase, N-terminal
MKITNLMTGATKLSGTPTDSYDPIGMTPLEVRLAMVAHGYNPTPINGKRPLLDGWQNIVATPDVVNRWGNVGPNTGMVTRDTPVLDIDILNEEAAQIVEATVRQCLEDNGQILVRVGLPPKRAILMRTDKPFKKILRKLTAPDGAVHKIEVLGDGQQLAVAGVHPDTNKPYVWMGGRSPVNTARDLLPSADDIATILNLCVDELKAKLGWAETERAAQPDISGDRPPLNERLAQTEYGGAFGINQALLDLPIARLNEGAPVTDVIAECEALVRAAWEKLDDERPEKNKWDWAAQRRQIEDSCYGFIRKACGENPRLIDTLPDNLLKLYRDIENRGGAPVLYKKRGLGRGEWNVKDTGPAEEIPTVDAEDIPTEERKLRFRLIKFQDMRPGLEPSYLVDELIPSAGLVLVWGKQKTFKSFWLLDLFVHVAMGWPYRDYAVRQGVVIYCAFEGGHGYKGRIEAIRRHYGISDDIGVPLYVMPGQVDLIADEKALVNEFRLQLGEQRPAVVVLDTLNRSLSGSESSDKDMTLYVKAAEAIRKAFGCVCIIVHHCGYDDTHARGHTSLPAAVDAELSVVRDVGSPVLLVTVKQMRDGPEGMQVRSRAHVMKLDPDQNGKPRSSIVIVPEDAGEIVVQGRHGGRPDIATPMLVEAVRTAIDTKGEHFVPDGKLPLQAVDIQHVREAFYRRYIDAEADAKKSAGAQKEAFKRALSNAVAKQIVNGQKDDKGRQLLWFVRDEGMLVE